MAASRASSVRALNKLAAGSKPQVRQLSMTGPATFPSALLTSERPAVNLPGDIAGLRAECKKRGFPTTGSKQELMDRLSTDELMQTRSFSSVVEALKRPNAAARSGSALPSRHFNTSRSLKAVNDSSTIDFAYFPDHDPDTSEIPIGRIPLISTFTPSRTGGYGMAEEIEVMRPTISTASADSTHISAPSAMHEVHDNSAMDIDYHGMAERISKAARKVSNTPIQEQPGMIKEVWTGLMDDMFGSKGQVSKA